MALIRDLTRLCHKNRTSYCFMKALVQPASTKASSSRVNEKQTEASSDAQAAKRKTKQKSTNPLGLYPTFQPNHNQYLPRVVALELVKDSVVWMSVREDGFVEEWDTTSFSLPVDKSGPLDNIRLHTMVNGLVEALPRDGVYLMKKKLRQVNSLKAVKLIQRQLLLEAMLTTLLNIHLTNSSPVTDSRVFLMSPNPLARFHDLQVAGEMVNVADKVKDLLTDSKTDGIHVPDYLKDFYFNLKHAEAVPFDQCLLMAYAFYMCYMAPQNTAPSPS